MYLFSLSRRSRDEISFGSCSGGAEVAPLALLASLGLTTTLVHEKKHEGQHRGKNDRRASQDIKVVRGHEKHEKHDGQDLPRPAVVDGAAVVVVVVTTVLLLLSLVSACQASGSCPSKTCAWRWCGSLRYGHEIKGMPVESVVLVQPGEVSGDGPSKARYIFSVKELKVAATR